MLWSLKQLRRQLVLHERPRNYKQLEQSPASIKRTRALGGGGVLLLQLFEASAPTLCPGKLPREQKKPLTGRRIPSPFSSLLQKSE